MPTFMSLNEPRVPLSAIRKECHMHTCFPVVVVKTTYISNQEYRIVPNSRAGCASKVRSD